MIELEAKVYDCIFEMIRESLLRSGMLITDAGSFNVEGETFVRKAEKPKEPCKTCVGMRCVPNVDRNGYTQPLWLPRSVPCPGCQKKEEASKVSPAEAALRSEVEHMRQQVETRNSIIEESLPRIESLENHVKALQDRVIALEKAKSRKKVV